MKSDAHALYSVSKDKLGLVRVMERAYQDAEDYLLGPHAALDYGDELPSVLRQNAEDFRSAAKLARELNLPHSDGARSCDEMYDELARRLEQLARAEERDLKRFRIQPIRGKH